MKKVIFILLILVSASCVAELYKWTDSDGIVHYTDRMPASAVQQDALPQHLKSIGEARKKDSAEPELVYEKLNISLPKADSIVRNGEGTVNIVVQINPPLTEEHYLQIYLDGLEVGEKTKSTALTLQKMQKGVHRLQAKILDKDNQPLMKTDEISFEFREAADLSKIAPNLVSKSKN